MGAVVFSDFVRSMFREGFSRDEVYDVLTGAGLPWHEVQLLIERVELELTRTGVTTRTAQIKKAVEEAIRETKNELLVQIKSLNRQLELLKVEARRRRPAI